MTDQATAASAVLHRHLHTTPPRAVSGQGVWLTDAQGRRYLDASGGAAVSCLGHSHPDVLAAMHQRFARLAQYAVDCGSAGLLFTCSAFGPCIEAVARQHAPMPVLKPNEAMIAQAVASGQRVGLIASFGPTLESMPPEFPPGVLHACELADGAMQALNAGDGARHDALVVDAALRLRARGAEVIALAQFSMARARDKVAEQTGLAVLTTVDSAVQALRQRLGH